MGTILITSRLGKDYIGDLERVLFFNPKQQYAAHAIRSCVEDYGIPEIVTENGYLRIRLKSFSIAQTLFLIDRTDLADILAGAIVYVRDGTDELSILHVAIAEDYISRGPIITARLVWDLLRHVIESASRIRGIKNIKLVYSNFLGKGGSKMGSIPINRHLTNSIERQLQPSKCPDSSITCFEYQRCFECPKKFITKTRGRLMAGVNTRSKALSPA
jgi:hypothetical protein